MARLVGVDLPREKRLEVALTYIYGVGRTRAQETRLLQVGPNTGQAFPVEVPTHLSVLASFEAGGQAQSLLSFDTPLLRQRGAFCISDTRI